MATPIPAPPADAWEPYRLTAVGFLESISQTLLAADDAMFAVADMGHCGGGVSEAECDASTDYGRRTLIEPARSAIADHLTYMAQHPAHACFADAYAGSADLMALYTGWFDGWRPFGDNTAEGIAQIQRAYEILDASVSFSEMDYYGDCP